MDQESGRRKRWTEADVPEQRGRIAVITGGNSGIGLETARVLAERGATVVLACRDIDKARDAAERLRVTAPGAEVKALRLDLGSLASVREAAQEIRSSCVQMGAQPTLRAAVDPDVRGGDYYGPAGLFELEGSPKRVESSARSHDIDAQRRLWEESQQLTGVTYSL